MKTSYDALPPADMPGGRRPVDTEILKKIIRAAEEYGIRQPIGVHEKDGKFLLDSGRHRLQAALDLGLETVPVFWLNDMSPLQREAWTIVARGQLDDVNQELALARLKEIYIELHPGDRTGAAQAAAMNRAEGNSVSDNLAPTFAEVTAEKTGMSQPSVERKVRRGENIKRLQGFDRPHELAEATALLRLSKHTLEKYRMTGVGGPPFVRIGSRVLYRRADLENWPAANLRRSTSERVTAT